MEQKKIAIIGLGYVGLPLARLFATKYNVVGFDINEKRVSELMSGTDATLEVSDEVLQAVLVDKNSDKNGLFCTTSLEDIKGHKFISSIAPLNNIPMMRWLNSHVDSSQISFRGSSFDAMMDAARHGLGISALGCHIAQTREGLIPVIPPPHAWEGDLWLVTHRDIHHSPKVQAFTQLLKRKMANHP